MPVKRFPGLDYNDSSLWRTRTRKTDGRAIRTTNWLTVLDEGFVAQLDGLKKLTETLGPACPVYTYDGGVVVQAGPHAELGDLNRRNIPEHYRTVARVLKPLRFEAYRMGMLKVPDPLDAREETLAWIARFD